MTLGIATEPVRIKYIWIIESYRKMENTTQYAIS